MAFYQQCASFGSVVQLVELLDYCLGFGIGFEVLDFLAKLDGYGREEGHIFCRLEEVIIVTIPEC